MAPDHAWDGDNDPIQGAEKQALDCMSVFVSAKPIPFPRAVGADKNKDAQRQSPAISGQVSDDSVAERFSVGAFAAAEEYKQSSKVDR